MNYLAHLLRNGRPPARAALLLLCLGLPAVPAPARPGAAPIPAASPATANAISQAETDEIEITMERTKGLSRLARTEARLRAAPAKTAADRKQLRAARANLQLLWGTALETISPAAALPHLEAAAAIFRSLRFPAEAALSLNQVGNCREETGRHGPALAAYREALTRSRWAGAVNAQARALAGLGTVYNDLKRPRQALPPLRQALTRFRRTEDKGGAGVALAGIGEAHAALGRPAQALGLYQQALTPVQAVGTDVEGARIIGDIGEAHAALGRPAQALGFYWQAMPLLQRAGDQVGAAKVRADIRAARRTLRVR